MARFVRKPLWLIVVAGSTVFTGISAFAQIATPAPAAADDTVKLEEFIVTGSLIPMAADTPAIPVTIITAFDIEKSGVSNDLLQVLKKTEPYFFGANNIGSENANIASGSTIGGSAVALRNRATLVLINGRRAAVNPVAAAGGANFVDVSLIPVSAVERIEILSDGASATYGSDAVSGVVNIILKTSYRGAEIGGRYGFSPNDANYSERSYFAVVGAGTDQTQITVSTEWKKSDPLIQTERPFGKNLFLSPTFAGVVNIGTAWYYLNPALNAPPLNLDLTPAQLVAAGIYLGPMSQAAVSQFFDLSLVSTMLLRAERRSLVTAMDHRLTDTITLFGDFIYTTTKTQSRLNAQPVGSFVTGPTATNPFVGGVVARNRFIAFPRIFNNEAFATRGVVGARGVLAGTWDYEVAANFNRTTSKFRTDNLISNDPYVAAIANLTYNPFARLQPPGVIEGFIGSSFRDFLSGLISFDARITGEIMDLPGGPLAAAFGADTRRETLSFTNDLLDRRDGPGGWLASVPRQPFKSSSTTDGLFVEFRVPIFGHGNSTFGFHVLDLSLAARKEMYSKTTDPFVPKYSLRWLPFNDEFAIRATYSESFSAPTLFNLAGPISSGFTPSINIFRFDTAGNPLNVLTGSRQYRSMSGSNPNLTPSQSRNWTAGVVWSPGKKLKGFSVSADWFNIDERDLISGISSALIVRSVEQFGPASPYASMVRFGESVAGESHFGTGTPVATPGQMSNRPSDSVWITNQLVNIAGVWQSGADVKVSYTYDTKTWGVLTARVSGVYLNEYVIQSLPTDTPFDFAGGYSGTSLFARWRAFAQLGWAYKNWTAGVNGILVPSVTDFASPGEPKVSDYRTFDTRVGYSFGDSRNKWLDGLSFNLGVNNAFNKFPPTILSEGNQTTDINAYDPIGRFYYMEARYKF